MAVRDFPEGMICEKKLAVLHFLCKVVQCKHM